MRSSSVRAGSARSKPSATRCPSCTTGRADTSPACCCFSRSPSSWRDRPRRRGCNVPGRAKISGFAMVAAVAASTVVIDAQPVTRRATNLAAVLAYPGYYHGRPILIVGKVGIDKDQFRVQDEAEHSIHLLFKGTPPDGLDEIRGEFWDLGRMKPDDPRLTGYDLRSVFKIDPDRAWPRPGDVA